MVSCLRAISASHLLAKNVSEKILQEKSRRRSLACLCAYEHTTADQNCTVKRVLESTNVAFTAEDSMKNSTDYHNSTPTHKQKQPCQSDRKNGPQGPVFFSRQLQNCVFNFSSG